TGMVLVHRGKIRWFWGDTSLAHYAMGHFGTATATSELPGKGGLDPSVGIDLDYAVDAQGNSRPTFAPGKPGPIWVHGAFVLKNPEGEDRIVTQYERVDPSMKRLELGLAAFDDEKQTFQ